MKDNKMILKDLRNSKIKTGVVAVVREVVAVVVSTINAAVHITRKILHKGKLATE